VVLRHIGGVDRRVRLATRTLRLPIGPVDALYNIAGALLFKVLKLTQYNAKGVSEEEQASCTAVFPRLP
jgi:hypothetical protein